MKLKLIPFKNLKYISIVYVHGFMGDEETFYDFPELIKVTMKLYKVVVINMTYTFQTSGDFEKTVNEFIAKLYNFQKAIKKAFKNEDIDVPIVLMGHSMGGILIADAFNKIFENKVEDEYRKQEPPYIIGVFGFDSPYLGLANCTLYNAGVNRFKKTVFAANGYNEKCINNNETLGSSNSNSGSHSGSPSRNNSNPNLNNTESKWCVVKKYLTYGLSAVAASAAIGASLLNQDTRENLLVHGQQILTEGTKYIQDNGPKLIQNYGLFLEPLLEYGKQNERLDNIISRIKFKNYYPITKEETENGTTENTFIKLPRKNNFYSNYFESIPAAKNATDPIYSHINMFNFLTNSENVNVLANKCIEDLYSLLVLS